MLITSNEYALKSLIAFQQRGKERMNWVFVKHQEQNTGFCYIPDAKFPGGFCDLAGFGLRFLIKSRMLHVLVFWEVLPRSFSSSKGNLDLFFGSKPNWGEIPDTGV